MFGYDKVIILLFLCYQCTSHFTCKFLLHIIFSFWKTLIYTICFTEQIYIDCLLKVVCSNVIWQTWLWKYYKLLATQREWYYLLSLFDFPRCIQSGISIIYFSKPTTTTFTSKLFIYVYLCLIHVEVWQKTTKFCKANILQLKNNLKNTLAFSPILGTIKSESNRHIFHPLGNLHLLCLWISYCCCC